MDLIGEYFITAPRIAVWTALNDIAVLKAAIPRCDEISWRSATEIDLAITARIGPVKISFKGLITLSDLDPPNSYTMRGEGQGSVAGAAKGIARVRLADAPDGTILHYAIDADVGGRLAQIGKTLLGSSAQKLADRFFAGLAEIIVSRVTPAGNSVNLRPT